MAVSDLYYLNGSTLSSSTAVFTDSSMITCASDGWYSDGTISRQQVDCVLLPQQVCAECLPPPVPCGSPIAGSGTTGIYRINLGLGTATGAIIITFNPISIPDGIIATLSSVDYNKLSSPNQGVLQSSAGGPTYVGQSGGTATCTSWYPSGGTLTNVKIYDWNGSAFVDTLTTTSLTITTGQIKTTTGQPNNCIMVIPKPTSANLDLLVTAFGPCDSTGWSINVACPAPLTSFTGSVVYGTATVPCSAVMNRTYYYAKVHSASDAYIGLYDYIFTDANGQFPLADGWYLISKVATPNKVMQITNGVVASISSCV